MLFIGARHVGPGQDFYFNGWLDELRVSKGIARWSANFTPPVCPPGQVQIDTTQSKFGTSSALFDGAGDYLSVGDSADWDFGTGDFSVDCWIKLNSTTATQAICAGSSASNGWILGIYNGNIYAYYDFTHVRNWAYSWDTNWHHLAYVRSGNNFNVYVDGQAIGSAWDVTGKSFDCPAGGLLSIGQDGTGANYFNGWLDELRISKGIARWSANFTPPQEQYQLDAGLISLQVAPDDPRRAMRGTGAERQLSFKRRFYPHYPV